VSETIAGSPARREKKHFGADIALPDYLTGSADPLDQVIRELAAESNRLLETLNERSGHLPPDKLAAISIRRATILDKLREANEAKQSRRAGIDPIRVLAFLMDLFIRAAGDVGISNEHTEVMVRRVAKDIERQKLDEKSLLIATGAER
jgi:antitoxin component HigA of HigAB toxin-antitoxin module